MSAWQRPEPAKEKKPTGKEPESPLCVTCGLEKMIMVVIESNGVAWKQCSGCVRRAS